MDLLTKLIIIEGIAKQKVIKCSYAVVNDVALLALYQYSLHLL